MPKKARKNTISGLELVAKREEDSLESKPAA
jgi:hypothetical protein